MLVRRFLFFLALVVCNVAISQSTDLGIKVMNYTDLSSVKQFGKLEIGVQLPDSLLKKVNNFLSKAIVPASQKINPFLEWELSIEAEMTHTESGTMKKIPAFYYREYARDTVNNTWKDVGTSYPMRVRFAPPLTGEWTCRWVVKVREELLPSPEQLQFQVISSENKGYIIVHSNQRNLQLGNQLIYPVGINFPAPIRGEGVTVYHTGPNGDLFHPGTTFQATKLSGWLTYHNDVRAFGQQGGRFIRTLQTGWSSLLEFEEKGNYYNRQHYAWEQDRLLEYCEQAGIYIHFNMMEQEAFMMYGNYDLFDWDWSHFNRDKSYFSQDAFPAYCYADRKGKLPSDGFSEEADLKYHEQRTRYYIARYGYSTSIYLFELLSEPYHMDEFATHPAPYTLDTDEGRKARAAVQKYHEHIASYIKYELQHTNQLVGINLYVEKIYEGETFLDQALYHPAIDVVSFNPYSKLPNKLIIAKSDGNNTINSNENSMARVISMLQARSGKPVMIAEGGPGDMVNDCSGFVQERLDMMSFGFIGLAGYNTWIGWDNGQDSYWNSILHAEDFLNSRKVLEILENGNGFWTQGRQAERHLQRDEEKGKETQYYVAQDQLSATGYVKNRSYNYYTKRTSDTFCGEGDLKIPFNGLRDIQWTDGRKYLVVEGLDKSKRYEVTWYDYITGSEINTEKPVQKLKRGKLRLQFPELSVTEGKTLRPEVWFTVKPVE